MPAAGQTKFPTPDISGIDIQIRIGFDIRSRGKVTVSWYRLPDSIIGSLVQCSFSLETCLPVQHWLFGRCDAQYYE